MPRLIDLILSKRGLIAPPRWNRMVMSEEKLAAHDSWWKDAIASAAPFIFEATNINEYMYNGTDQEFWQPDRDFPCLAPPSYISWFEYGRPSGILTTVKDWDKRFSVQHLPWKTGVLVFMCDPTVDAKHKEHFDRNVKRHLKEESHWQKVSRPLRDIANAKCFLQLILFATFSENDAVIGPMSEIFLYLDQNYDCFEHLMFTIIEPDAKNSAFLPQWPNNQSGMDNLIYPTMLAITMLNLKNVSTKEVKPAKDDSKKHRQKYVERHGREQMTFKTLEITPIARLTAAAIASSPSEEPGTRKIRSHVYRGYVLRSGVDGRKHIFGNPNITGRFWVAPGTRGGKQGGEVVKDYKFGEVKNG